MQKGKVRRAKFVALALAAVLILSLAGPQAQAALKGCNAKGSSSCSWYVSASGPISLVAAGSWFMYVESTFGYAYICSSGTGEFAGIACYAGQGDRIFLYVLGVASARQLTLK